MTAETATKVRYILNPARTEDGEAFVFVEYDGARLSLTGVIGPRANGDARGSCGQIDMSLRETTPLQRAGWTWKAGWSWAKLRDLLDVWDRWHLNDMNAGTPEQEAFIRGWKETAEGVNALNHYDRVCAALREAGLYVAEHPEQERWGVGRGYRYGTAWLAREVPEDVVRWLFDLPPAAAPVPTRWLRS